MSAIDTLWQLAYDSFENRPGDAIRTVYAHKGMANEIQFRLGRNIAELKRNGPSEHTISAIRADVLLAEATSFITKETSENMIKLLKEIA